ncbi:copper homeostasis protein CutC [Halpernia frigidisoli]|uniref:PF03932 family protein CutC n=1 Tax=Halpernia frigidisoli TaxID=1125876 RepID=A0A1I3FWU5_9FLAO|nr:copper homeostasis protein CutC [Halpernia frigidisoli]SFI15710.1 copper homeostasis protein [Halpernia frigidisoli]
MLEIACFEITSAEIALKSSAGRIELCKEITLGGLTPEIEEFKFLKEKYLKPIYVMIRPKGGGFFYDEDEFSLMIKSIELFKKFGANGFVFGILDENNEVDLERNSFLVELAKPIPCTFHRAFDRTKNLEKSCETLIEIGFKTILTSGGEKTALEGKESLKNLIEKYSGKINILIGGNVRSENIEEIKIYTKGTHFHSSAIPSYEQFANDEEIRKMKRFSV